MIKSNLFKTFQQPWFEKVTLIVAIFGQFCPYLQAYKIFMLESSYAVSVLSQVLSLSSTLFWLAYGYSRNIYPLIVSNLVGIIGIILVFIGLIKY